MGAGVRRGRGKHYRCDDCGLFYKEKKWAKECYAWCVEHKSCNLGITKHAVQRRSP